MRAITDPEGALVGALMHLPAPSALEVLDRINDDDVADPTLQKILGAIRQLAEDGIAPDPVTVWTRLRSQGAVSGADANRQLATTLSDVYVTCPVPASVDYYRAAVMDEALRRRCAELGARMVQAAGSAPLDVLVDVLDRECRAVRALLDRRGTIATDDAPARLRAVGA